MTSVKVTSREALLAAAASVLAKNPGASLQEIASKAGVGRATLHRHFPARDDLLRELLRDALRQIDAATQHIEEKCATAEEALRELLEAVVPLGDRFHFLWSEPAVADDAEIRETHDRQLREMTKLVEAAKAEGAIAQDIATAWAITVIDMLIYAIWSAVQDGHVARRDAADLSFRTLMHGLAPSDTR